MVCDLLYLNFIMESCNNSQSQKSWLGSSIPDLCNGKGPWSFNISPVTASKYHAVLYNLPVTLDGPPKPHHNSQPQHWNADYVRMPYSEKNLFPTTENGEEVIKSRWKLISQTLSRPIKNSRELESAIMTYNTSLPNFLALHYFFEEVLQKEETEHFFKNILPKIIKLALQLPEIVPGSIPLLKKNYNRSVSLSQLQIACLLANAFLCTFPWRKDMACSFPGVNFVRLFTSFTRPARQSCVSEKLKCLVHYFRRVTDKCPIGTITFERKFIHRSSMPRWDASNHNLGNTKIHIDSSGTIEDGGLGFLQVDFANRNVGGGVLGYGCVQEEIRFVICPELIISRLFIERLGDHEAVIVTGAERYSKYTGYGETFKWDGNFEDETPFDEYGRRRTAISIIDATHFGKPSEQFYPSAILRELNKAYVGFSSREKDNLAPVATGNWGCGAFRGSSELKSLIQLMACCVAGRDLVYFSFGDEELRDAFYNMYIFIATNRITVIQLWRFLCSFSTTSCQKEKLYPYIQQAFFDNKKQPSIKKFFGFTTRKKENEIPSTSSNTPETKFSKNKNNGSIKKTNTKIIDTIDTNSTKKASDESISESPEIIDNSDEDIYPPTPEELIKNKNVKKKLTYEEVSKKLPKTDVVELIDIIDGNANRTKEKMKEDTFLSEIDKLKRRSVSNKPEEGEKMEVDTNELLMNCLAPDNKASKRKITDYFQLKSPEGS